MLKRIMIWSLTWFNNQTVETWRLWRLQHGINQQEPTWSRACPIAGYCLDQMFVVWQPAFAILTIETSLAIIPSTISAHHSHLQQYTSINTPSWWVFPFISSTCIHQKLCIRLWILGARASTNIKNNNSSLGSICLYHANFRHMHFIPFLSNQSFEPDCTSDFDLLKIAPGPCQTHGPIGAFAACIIPRPPARAPRRRSYCAAASGDNLTATVGLGRVVQLWPEIPVISTDITPSIECIIP